jgi:hypothetical protein
MIKIATNGQATELKESDVRWCGVVMCMYEVANVLVKLKGSTEGVFLVSVCVLCGVAL